ncbi:MAG: pitrilysin family protein [Bacilli bacterium]|nr:pitrilysin family protein [Bacilli bacterium]
MRYKKFELGSYNLHVIHTDKFKTITVKMNFRRDVKKEEVTIRNILADVMVKSTEKYHSERLMNQIAEELYGITYQATTTISGRYNILSFEYMFLSDSYTEEGNTEKSMQFISDMLFKPHVKNSKFDENAVYQAKKSLGKVIEGAKENPDAYSLHRMFEEMEPDMPISFKSDGYIEDLEKVDEKNLYKYYQNVMQRDLVDIFVIGDISESKIKKMMEKNFLVHTFKKHSHSHYIKDHKMRFRAKTVVEKEANNQSKLVVGANISQMNLFESNYVSYVYSYILGGSADSKLFQTLREKHSLCYYAVSNVYRLNQMLVIQSGIDKENSKKAISLIKKELKNMSSGKFTEEDITGAKVTYIASLKQILDSPGSVLNMYVSQEYLHLDLMDERIKQIGRVTKKDVMAFAKKIKLNTIYLLEGEGEEHDDSVS